MKRTFTHIVGIDEVGRGPLAGPVAVGIAVVPAHFNWRLLPETNDSKLLSGKKREEIFREALLLKKQGMLSYTVSMVGAPIIDRIGIVPSVRLAMKRGLGRMKLDPNSVRIKLDGSLVAPDAFLNQETIIKGDQKEKVIGLASIIAKVTRDRHMQRLAKRYPVYDFHKHKGYGTQVHRDALVSNGPCEIHRFSFIHNVVGG